MSWTSRLGNLGRFSPFTRSPPQGSVKVSDADFSYITADDLRKHQAESSFTQEQQSESPSDYGPPRDTDVLILRNKKQEYSVHFAAYSIAKGELTIAQLRDSAARKIGLGDPRRVKLLYKGKNLKDDSRTCKQEGLRDGAEIMCTISEVMASDSESDDDCASGADDAGNGADQTGRRRRNRGKKTKRRNKREDREAGSGTNTPLSVPNNTQASASRPQSPKPPPSPATPLDKLNALHAKLQSFIPDCRAFETEPPSDPAKKQFEHKRLSETILTQVLLKLDAVETEGDADAKLRRKELVKETQQVLQDLDTAMKS